MPSSSDQFPDPWNLNRPDDNDKSSPDSEKNTPKDGDDEFGLDELEALLSETSQENDSQVPEPSFGDLESMFSLESSPSDEDGDPDFDAMLASLQQEPEAATDSSSSPNLGDLSEDLDETSEVVPEPLITPEPMGLQGLQLGADAVTEENIVPEIDIAAPDLSGADAMGVSTDELLQVSGEPGENVEIGQPDLEPGVPDLSVDVNDNRPPVIDSGVGEVDLPTPTLGGLDAASLSDGETINLPEASDSIPDLNAPISGGSGSIPDVDVSTPDVSASIPDIEPDLPEISASAPDLSATTPSVEPSLPDVNADIPDINASIPDISTDTDSDELTAADGTISAIGLGASLSDSAAGSSESSLIDSAPNQSAPTGGDMEDPSSNVPSENSTPETPVVSQAETSSAAPASSVPQEPSIPGVPSGSSSPASVSPASPSATPVATGKSASSATPVASKPTSSSSGGRASGGGTSTYKQLLGGRQQIAAFAIVLAGMGGITTYGLSKANILNPLKAGLDDVGIGLLADPSSGSDDSDPLAASSDDPSAVATAQNQVGEGQAGESSTADPLLNPLAQAGGEGGETALGGSASNIGGLEESDESAVDNEALSDGATSDVDSTVDSRLQTPPPIDISDVPPDHWAHSYVVAMHEQGVIPDFPDGKFQPDRPVTRAELAASIQRAFQDQAGAAPIPFSDIPEGFWARDAITHSVNTGFMSGYSDDIFEPDQQIPRYQVLVSLVSGLGLEKINDPQEASEVLQSFPDTPSMPDWALGQVAASKKANLIINQPGDEENLSPTRPATRAEVSAMIYQALVSSGKIEDTVN